MISQDRMEYIAPLSQDRVCHCMFHSDREIHVVFLCLLDNSNQAGKYLHM